MSFYFSMHITPILNTNINNKYGYKRVKPNFTAHPDFYKYNSTLSCYFRRGAVSLASKGYEDIENLFKIVFNPNKNQIKNMLIIGIGNSQEPFSYLASIKSILKDKQLNSRLDLHTVDLQSKPDDKKLWENAFYDGAYEDNKKPRFALDSFVEDEQFPEVKSEPEISDPLYLFIQYYNSITKKRLSPKSLDYRVNDEILDFLKSTYNNPQKSKWDSPVQEVIKEYPNQMFDVISANNVLPYIINEDTIIETIKHIIRTLKPKGYFITDPYKPALYIEKSGILNPLKEVKEGIYQKI